jgi:hypothetical protein
MTRQEHILYYVARRADLLAEFEREAQEWRSILARDHGAAFASQVLQEARNRFTALIPHMPFIGGDENLLTTSLIGSARCLAFYQAMSAQGESAAATGKVLYDAARALTPGSLLAIPPAQRLTRDELMDARRWRAARSQELVYAWDWVYEFVEGVGGTFDYGYDFTQCATYRFYLGHNAFEFLPYYCFLDFPRCELSGLGLTRTMTLGEGHGVCDFRFKEGGKAALEWPPPFLSAEQGSQA